MSVNNDDTERVREAAYTQQLMAYENQQEEVVQIKFHYNAEKTPMVQSRIILVCRKNKMLRGLMLDQLTPLYGEVQKNRKTNITLFKSWKLRYTKVYEDDTSNGYGMAIKTVY